MELILNYTISCSIDIKYAIEKTHNNRLTSLHDKGASIVSRLTLTPTNIHGEGTVDQHKLVYNIVAIME